MTGKKSAVGSWQLAESPSSLPTANCQLPTPLVIGHRGAAAHAPENTLVSFERALASGADGIEFDVRLARDGRAVVIHDRTLRRTALRGGPVSDFSSKELSRMDAGTWFNLRHPKLASPDYARATIPTLEEVFEAVRGGESLLYVEMKCGPSDRAALAAEVARLVRTHSLLGRVVVESFDLPAIVEVKRVGPSLRTAALFDRRLSRPVPSARGMVERAIRCGAEEIALHHSLATRGTISEAARRGLETVVWTVDNPAWVERVVKRGVRAIITNDPARICARRSELFGEGTRDI